MSSIIQVENLSKSFTLHHEGKERYTALRDVVANKAKKVFSFPKNLKPAPANGTREEFWALKDVSFNIEQGDRVGIIGRNGAGKSTLLKILSRITEPTKGSIKIKGRVASLLEVGTGFHPELTGRENIYLNGAILGMSRGEIKKKFDEIVDFAEVEKFLDTPVKRYSSGMYVRLAFAVAAHLEPEILVVDEVLAVGDAQFQKKCLGKMEGVSKNEGRTVLFVSHQMGTIAQLCNKGIFLKNGHIFYSGATKEIIEKYLTNDKVGSNRYECNAANRHGALYFKEISTFNQFYEETDQFGFDHTIGVMMKIVAKEKVPNVKVGFNILNNVGAYVTSSIEHFDYNLINSNNTFQFLVTLPPSIIAPNLYSFRFAIFDEHRIYDVIENECHIKISDTGTKLARYEGIDYGNVVLDITWKNSNN